MVSEALILEGGAWINVVVGNAAMFDDMKRTFW